MNKDRFKMARFSRQLSSKAKNTLVVLSVFLVTSLVSGAATTHIFENLQKFGLRLVVGDPDLTPANTTDGPKDIAVADLNGDNHSDLVVANKDGSVTL
ncbi:MAG TPA: hypothetical protein VGE41_10380, partial [Verrucomicrobiae bacterium]